MHMSNLAIKVNEAWPDAVKSMDVSIEGTSPVSQTSKQQSGADSFAFADIYLRSAPCYFKGLMLQARGEDVKGTLREPDAGLLMFEKGACELSATSLFLTVAMSAADENSLVEMQTYLEDKLRTLSPQTKFEIEWRNK
ncbi:DUF2218 domain-containing protein [Thalassospira sp. HF15]|uniref:DUF2218 domain-containing protein n=1 Tax=Thalassospira sp. HF15 TaxID=2722755 RepID=UPI001430E751|nr:DUF2218 domain-containing protein [Thalassospira sp. HF15]NIY76459.1 DUF2218 domain-containing protein [Thalassospira sp. HF15]